MGKRGGLIWIPSAVGAKVVPGLTNRTGDASGRRMVVTRVRVVRREMVGDEAGVDRSAECILLPPGEGGRRPDAGRRTALPHLCLADDPPRKYTGEHQRPDRLPIPSGSPESPTRSSIGARWRSPNIGRRTSVRTRPNKTGCVVDGHQEVRTLQLPLEKLRRAARRHGRLAIQGLRPRPAVCEVCLRQVRGPQRRPPRRAPRAAASPIWSRSRATRKSATR